MRTGPWRGIAAAWWVSLALQPTGYPFSLEVEQITRGPNHHFFGYIGHAGTIPWNQSERYILALRTGFQDHLPGPNEPAEIVLIDVQAGYAVKPVTQTRAWNLQQGSMLYWNPEAAETQFFFNDRDPKSGKMFCALFDISRGDSGERIREYRFNDTPIGNSGVAQRGGFFLGLNYGRLARLRPVTGYAGAFDWTEGLASPATDGIFKVKVGTGEKQLLVSFATVAEALRPVSPDIDRKELFVNHTLWSRDDSRILFFARAAFDDPEQRVNVAFVMDPLGADLRMLPRNPGGHPEWADGRRLIGRNGDWQVFYDTDRFEDAGRLGDPDVLPDAEGDIALSPDGAWFVNGYRRNNRNHYVFLRLTERALLRSPGFDVTGWTSGPLRIDPAPCWNRSGNAVLVPALSLDEPKTRQLFLIRIVE